MYIYTHSSSPEAGFTLLCLRDYGTIILQAQQDQNTQNQHHLYWFLSWSLSYNISEINTFQKPFVPPEYSKERDCWVLLTCSLSHLAVHTHVSKEAPLGNQYTNPDRHTGCCFCKMPLFHQPNSNKLLKSSGIYQQLVMSSGLSSYFRSSLCSHIRKTLGRLSFTTMGEVHTSASKASESIWAANREKAPRANKEREDLLHCFQMKQVNQNITDLSTNVPEKISLSYISGRALGKLCFCPQLS